jgi:uncharacterized membrane protein
MLTRLPLFLRHITYNLRGGFLVRPLIIALVLGFSGGLTSTMETVHPVLNTWMPRWLFPSNADPQVAQIILAAIATSVMTVVSIVFAILLMTLTLASMQFSPRILVTFAQDRVTQWTLGAFLGTFVAWLLFFIHHISLAISVNHIVDNIAGDTEAVIDEMMPKPILHPKFRAAERPLEAGDQVPVASLTSGYLRYVDLDRLLTVAKSHHIGVQVLRRFGHFVPAGVPLMTVSKEHKLTPELEDELRSAFDIGPSRTLQQDVEYGILQIVDIALKAISPAVNDPTTAITCVDQLSRILIRFAGREPFEYRLYDPPGVLRVAVPPLSLDRLVDSAFEQIRQYAKADAAVSLRLLRALCDLGTVVPDISFREFLVGRALRVVAGTSEKLSGEELAELRSRFEGLQRTLIPSAPTS